jgi:hypothetical protein
VEDGQVWDVGYVIDVDKRWRSTTAVVRGRSAAGIVETFIKSDGDGRWHVDGRPAPQLDGCLDVDLESSACTNTLPVHRLGLEIGDAVDAPAVYVRAPSLAVERLDQSYRRIQDRDGQRYDYAAPRFNVAVVLVFDEAGLVTDYPGLAVRIPLRQHRVEPSMNNRIGVR